jgi:hypothetical protein
MTRPRRHTDRGQAFTLEGVVASITIMIALLLSVQTMLMSPATGGEGSALQQAELKQESRDILRVVADNDTFDLSAYVRYWSPARQTFVGAHNPRVGYGNKQPPKQLGTLLHETFTSNGFSYNVIVEYNNESLDNGTERIPFVYRGPPAADAVVAKHPVLLSDTMVLRSPESTAARLTEYDTDPTDTDDSYYPIPDAAKGPTYNVAEVRVIVW